MTPQQQTADRKAFEKRYGAAPGCPNDYHSQMRLGVWITQRDAWLEALAWERRKKK
jgi:hypothetical protein